MWSFALAVLATWRLTHLLAEEDGPADFIVRFRALLGNGLAGKLMDCFYCLSFWIAAPAALFITRRPLEWLMNWLALSGGACLLERVTNQHDAHQTALPAQEGESGNVLRFETHATEEQPGFEHKDGKPSIHGPARHAGDGDGEEWRAATHGRVPRELSRNTQEGMNDG